MYEHVSTYFALAVNWRYWLEMLYQYGRIPSVIIFIGGITVTLIYLVRLLRSTLQQLKTTHNDINTLAEAIGAIQISVTGFENRTDKELSCLHESLGEYVNQQEYNYKALLDAINLSDSDVPVSQSNKTLVDDVDPSPFPTSVTDYISFLRKNNSNGIEAKSEVLLSGNLTSSTGGEFVVVSDGSTNEYLVVPKVERFSSGDEFSILFGDYFDCIAPSAGEVWIRRPAFVQSDEVRGGWRVARKGELEVR